MKKDYIAPLICDIYSERLMYDPQDKQGASTGGDVSGETGKGGSKRNVTVWDDEEDDNWGADSYTGF